MALCDGDGGVATVELLELARDGATVQTLLEQHQRELQRRGLQARGQPLLGHVLEHRLLNLLAEINILRGKENVRYYHYQFAFYSDPPV